MIQHHCLYELHFSICHIDSCINLLFFIFFTVDHMRDGYSNHPIRFIWYIKIMKMTIYKMAPPIVQYSNFSAQSFDFFDY